MTGQVIRFSDFAPTVSATPRVIDLAREPASIIIMPVVRVERHPDKPSEGLAASRPHLKRRKLVPINFCGND